MIIITRDAAMLARYWES